MDKILYIPSIFIGTLLTIIYVVQCYKKDIKVDLQVIINNYIVGSGAVGGFLLFLSSFITQLREYISGMNLYIAISGVAVFTVSLHSLFQQKHYKLIFKSNQKHKNIEEIYKNYYQSGREEDA